MLHISARYFFFESVEILQTLLMVGLFYVAVCYEAFNIIITFVGDEQIFMVRNLTSLQSTSSVEQLQ